MIDNRCNLNNDYTERILYIEFNMYRPRMFFFFFFSFFFQATERLNDFIWIGIILGGHLFWQIA